MRVIYIVRRYFYDGDCYRQYNDVAFYESKESADRKCEELKKDEDSGYEEYVVKSAKISK